ncbi:hypothetical protein NDU88_000371 [Pleurodeles waltl]|uniref:Retrotransposon gag domain-containing protein n=1 Tax=Pleurodeles waltl TaxID=8319 RepID=A0AAV7MKM7_PLEWA|nr:hypothetical protein NDU88_000371 [Pleurodeles waltl]
MMEVNNGGALPSTIFQCLLPLDLTDSQTNGARWEKRIRRFERYLSATCKGHTDEQARDLFLNLVGDDVEDLFVTFPLESIATYKGLIKCLTDKFDPQRIVDFERYTFTTACQQAHESLDDFATQLCKLVAFCEFDTFDNEAAIRLRTIEGCHSTAFCTKVLKETSTLDKILTMARSEARATSHAIQMHTGRVRTMEQARSSHGRRPKQTRQAITATERETRADLLPLWPGIPACRHVSSHGTQVL